MAVKKGIVLAGVAGTAGSPVVGYFVYRHLTDHGQHEGDQPQQTTSLEPKTTGSLSYNRTSGNFKAGACAKKLFSGVDFQFLGSSTTTGDLELKQNGTGTVDACLSLDAMQQGEKGALAASTELAVTQGNKGFVMWTVVLGKAPKASNLREEIRIVHLEKKSDKWEPTKGYSWFTKPVAGTNSPQGIKIKVTGDGAKTLDNSDGKVWDDSKKESVEVYGKKWTFKEDSASGTEQIFSKLEITYKDESKITGLFGTKDYELPKPYFLYGTMDTSWKWSPKDKGFYKKVEIPFKSTKGKWEEIKE